MAKQVINIGSAPNDGTGDPIRTAFIKANENFTELYDGQFSGDYNDLTNQPSIPTDLTDLGITDGSSGQVLTTNGTGTFSFTTVSGGGGGVGLASRDTISGSTGNIANDAAANVDLTGYKGYILYKIQTNGAAWVTVYADAASRTADASRTSDEYPADGSGVVAEVITSGAETVLITPGVIGFNNENPITDVIPIKVVNLSGGVFDVTVTVTALEIEV